MLSCLQPNIGSDAIRRPRCIDVFHPGEMALIEANDHYVLHKADMMLTLRANMPNVTERGWGWVNLSWLAVVVGGVYILSAKLSLSLLTPDGVAVNWPAAGVAAGALIAFGPRTRWAVAAGTMFATIVANLLGDRNVVSSIVFGLCNAGEALLTAGVIGRYFNSPFSLDRLRPVLGLLAAAVFATAVSGVGGTLGFVLLHGATSSVLDHLAELVRIGRARYRHDRASGDRACLGST